MAYCYNDLGWLSLPKNYPEKLKTWNSEIHEFHKFLPLISKENVYINLKAKQ